MVLGLDVLAPAVKGLCLAERDVVVERRPRMINIARKVDKLRCLHSAIERARLLPLLLFLMTMQPAIPQMNCIPFVCPVLLKHWLHNLLCHRLLCVA